MSDTTRNSRFDDLLLGYVERALALQQQGVAVDLDLLCADHPELATAVAQALDLAPGLAYWQKRASATEDRLLGCELAHRYTLRELIGRGAMGSVYVARDSELGRDVAVKVLQPGLFVAGAETRFEREANVLARLEHEHVVRIYDRGTTEDGLPYLVTERLIGAPLAAVIQILSDREQVAPGTPGFCASAWLHDTFQISVSEPNYVRVAVRWVADLASGLAVAHDANVLHRDVKPSNAFIRTTGQAVLLDFGIAVHSSDATTLAADGLGTPSYMAPEQASGGIKPTHAVDVYGLTATLYHLLTGRPPYSGDPRSVLAKIGREDPVPAERFHPGLARDLQAILDRGMARRPTARYASATELRADLLAFLDHRPVGARPLRPWTRTWRRIRRSREARVLAGVAVLMLLAASYWAWSDHRAKLRANEHAELRTHRPATLGFSGRPEARRIPSPGERALVEAHLDRAIELAPDNLVDRLDRAAFRLDHGDSTGAADDVRFVAQLGDSPYLQQLAERYEALPNDADGQDHLDLTDLPEPRSNVEWFVASFHAIRGKTKTGYLDARTWLAKAASEGYRPAQRLLPLAILVATDIEPDPLARSAQFDDAREAALRVEGQQGHPSARTRHVIGSTFVGQNRHEEAIEPIRQAIELWPFEHAAYLNLGKALSYIGQNEEAVAALQRALELRPTAWFATMLIAEIHLDQDEFEAARTAIQSFPPSLGVGREHYRDWMNGISYLNEALAQLESGQRPVLLAEQARKHFRQAMSLGWDADRAAASIKTCDALIEGSDSAVFDSLLRSLDQDPLDGARVRQMRAFVPEEPTAKHVRGILQYLDALAQTLAPIK